MRRPLRVGIIGDHEPERLSHIATVESLDHAAQALGVPLDVEWVPTAALAGADSLGRRHVGRRLAPYDALWCSPGSPYRSTEGAHAGIRYAREQGRPFLGT
jgi:CTP synthase (UTP-ammonia lyase)